MELDINDEKTITNPDAATIERELRSLGVEEFAVLKQEELTFMQTFVEPDSGPVLEYQTGSIEQHFGAQESTTMEDVIKAFISYSKGTDEWKSMFTWEHMKMQAVDYAIMLFHDPSQIGDDFNPLRVEERVDLPELTIDHLPALNGILLGQDDEVDLELTFLKQSSAPPELDSADCFQIPAEFQTALAELDSSSFESVAAKWRASDFFPDDVYDDEELIDTIAGMSEMANDALQASLPLIFVSVD